MKSVVRIGGSVNAAGPSGVRASRRANSSRVRSFRASTSALDRHGTIVLPQGIRTEKFDKNPVFGWAHNLYGTALDGAPSIDSILGRVISHRKTKDAFDIDVEFATADVNPKADTALKLVDGGYLSAVSIGFIALSQTEEQRGSAVVPIISES